jgi:multidrug efflux system outer membrane protein
MRKILTFFFLTLLSAGFYSSCKVGPDYIRQNIDVPPHYAHSFPEDSSVANIPWWELFGDSVLAGIIKTTLENNKDLKISASKIKEAQSALGVVRAGLYPSINYYAGGSSVFSTGSSGFSHDYSGFIDVSYTIDVWGRMKRLNESALQVYMATEEAYRAVTIMLVAETATTYFSLRDIDNRLLISEQTAETWRSNLDIVEARYKGGFVSEVDLNQAKIQLLDALTAIETFTRLRRQTENVISFLMSGSPQTIPRGMPLENQLLPPQIPVGMPSELLERRPDILIAERLLRAQTEKIGAAEALRYPSFTISAAAGMNFINPVAGFASLGAQILGPIFNKNALKLQVEIEKEKTNQLLLDYEQKFITALKEVDDAMIAVTTYKKEFELRKEQLNASSEALKLSWIRYDGGMTNYLEVLDLQRSLFSSQLSASAAFQMQLVSIVKLYEALGGGWESGIENNMHN